MDNLEQRVKTLEEKVKLLEETMVTLKNMNVSEQMSGYIQSRQKSLQMIDLLNAVSDGDRLDFEKERIALNNIQTEKRSIDAQIAQALSNAGTFSDNLPCDPRNFNYRNDGKKGGLFITAYNGFGADRVIIPNEIDGIPVVGIEREAFLNTDILEVILPRTLKYIGVEAFYGCKNLKQIDLPNTIIELGERCFKETGIIDLVLPPLLEQIPTECCYRCESLKTVSFGARVTYIGDGAFCGCSQLREVSFGAELTNIGYSAFSECSQLREVSLPESLLYIEEEAFRNTAVETMIIPSGAKEVYLKSGTVFVFLGKDTVVKRGYYNHRARLIYCLPGSIVQQWARANSIPIKPLSAFRMEDQHE